MRLAPHSGAAAAALALALGAAAPAAAAVSADNFLLRTTEDLVALCDARQGDPQGVAAIHQCQGFLIGFYQYHQSITAGGSGRAVRPVFCLPQENAPTRDSAARMFVTWSRAHPQHMAERPVDTVARFAAETWPCPRPARGARPAAAPTTRQP